jgi:hypothetical protein
MPSGIVSIVSTMASTYAIAKGFSRWLAIDILLIPTLLGSCLMSFLPTENKGGCLAGIYLVNTVCSLWVSNFTSLTCPDRCSARYNICLDGCQLQRIHHEGLAKVSLLLVTTSVSDMTRSRVRRLYRLHSVSPTSLALKHSNLRTLPSKEDP